MNRLDRPDEINQRSEFGPQKDVTHLKTAINESNVGAGEVEPPLDLGDGALHVCSCQSLGEAGEGQRHDEQLQNTKGKYLIRYSAIFSYYLNIPC